VEELIHFISAVIVEESVVHDKMDEDYVVF
jgi:hypothetical protein